MPADDAAWSAAQLGAEAAYEELKKDPSKFDQLARDKSDEASAQGETGTGGKLRLGRQHDQLRPGVQGGGPEAGA